MLVHFIGGPAHGLEDTLSCTAQVGDSIHTQLTSSPLKSGKYFVVYCTDRYCIAEYDRLGLD